MLKGALQTLFNFGGSSSSEKSLVDRLRHERDQLREERDQLRETLCKDGIPLQFVTTEDFHAFEKRMRVVDQLADFGKAEFADLSCWLFASSLSNYRYVSQRVDEGSLLWRAVKMSGGPILEVGRGLGGSTALLLGASGERPVVSIDDREATNHSPIANHIFQRPDVARRLKLYRQTSRETISEQTFGMMFIDGDHSYEGVCHDIGTFWNSLKTSDGKPAIAAFHDAAANPICFVESVKQACDELLAEPGVARVVDSWGSMLVVEKLRDIDPEVWFKKELAAFWQLYAAPEYPVLRPRVRQGRLHGGRPALRLGTKNALGGQNVDGESWVRRGMTLERAPEVWITADNALRLVRETPETGEHGIERSVPLNCARFNFTAFVRPHHLRHLRLAISGDGDALAHADFGLSTESRIEKVASSRDVEILDASFEYRNGCFRCSLALAVPAPVTTVVVAVRTLDPSGEHVSFAGNPDRGFFVNLIGLREVL